MKLIPFNILFSKVYFIVGAWFVALILSLSVFINYKGTAGVASSFSDTFPEGVTQVPFQNGKKNFYMFVHPACNCTEASWHQLKELLPNISSTTQVTTVILMPESQKGEWGNSKLLQEIIDHKVVKHFIDKSGEEFKRFDAQTSGQSFLFDESGKLLFRGGITESRGHIGYNLGQKIVEDFASKSLDLASNSEANKSLKETAPFGCHTMNNNEQNVEVDRDKLENKREEKVN